jgi:hypothetical protein
MDLKLDESTKEEDVNTMSRSVGMIAGAVAVVLIGAASLVVTKISTGAGQAPKALAPSAASSEPGAPSLSENVIRPLDDPPQRSLLPEKPGGGLEVASPSPVAPTLKVSVEVPRVDGPPLAAIGDDPEGAAEAFLVRARQEATQAVDALTKEAVSLRERLKKVETALSRYRGTLGALDAATGGRGHLLPRPDDSEIGPAPFPPHPLQRPAPLPPDRPQPTAPRAVDEPPAALEPATAPAQAEPSRSPPEPALDLPPKVRADTTPPRPTSEAPPVPK